MSVAYVAVYEQGGNSTPTGDADRDRPGQGPQRAVPDQPELAERGGQPDRRERVQRRRRPAVVAVHRQHAAGPGRLPGRGVAPARPAAPTSTGIRATARTAQGWTRQANGRAGQPELRACASATRAATPRRGSSSRPAPARPSSSGRCPAAAAPATRSPSPLPGNQTSAAGTAATLQIHATDSAAGQTLTYGAAGLPAGPVDQRVVRPHLRDADRGRHVRPSPSPPRTPPARPGRPSFSWTVEPGQGRTAARRNVALNRPATSSSTESGGYAAGERGRRQHRHPLVQRVRRSAVDRRRPRLDPVDLPGGAELADRRTRKAFQLQTSHRRHDLDDDLLHDDRAPAACRPSTVAGSGPLRPDVRHRPRHAVRLLAVGVPGVRRLSGWPARERMAPGPAGDHVPYTWNVYSE